MGVGAGRHDDRVLRGGVDHDDRRAAGPGQADHAVQPDLVVAQVGAQLLGRRVVAECRDELHRRAGAGGGHRLIAALAAGRRRERRRENGLARPRQGIHCEREIGVDTAHHADPRHHNVNASPAAAVRSRRESAPDSCRAPIRQVRYAGLMSLQAPPAARLAPAGPRRRAPGPRRGPHAGHAEHRDQGPRAACGRRRACSRAPHDILAANAEDLEAARAAGTPRRDAGPARAEPAARRRHRRTGCVRSPACPTRSAKCCAAAPCPTDCSCASSGFRSAWSASSTRAGPT